MKMRDTKSRIITAILMTCILLITAFLALPPTNAVQPPISQTSYYKATIGQPRRVDPACAYDTASGELIFNVYETLIFPSSKIIPTVPINQSIDMAKEGMADLSQFTNVLATAMPVITKDPITNITTWTFTIDTTIPWQPWQAANGTWYYEFVTAEDVEYSFKREFVQDCTGPNGPSWMLALPLTGYMFYDELDGNTATNTLEPVNAPSNTTHGEKKVQALIEAAITRTGNNVSLNMLPNAAWPVTAFNQILSQTWGSICNKDFCIEHGCWNGTFYDGWSTDYRRKPSNSYTPLDSYYAAKSMYPSSSSVPAMCGTGPYIFNYWHKADLEYQVYAWENLSLPGIPGTHVTYRGGWNAVGNVHSLRTITVKGIAEWSKRKMMFLAGDSDVVAVPRANMYDLLSGDVYTPLPGILLYYNSPSLSNDVASFVLNVDPATPYMPKINGVNTTDFFGDDNVRRAFAQTLNFTQYLADAWWNEAIQPCTWWVEGLASDYKNKTLEAEKWNDNTANFKTELQNSAFGDLWDKGFETYLVYNLGNGPRKIACEMMRDAIQSQNALRPGKDPFVVNVVGLDWPTFLDYEARFWMPMFFVGWLADFADADNFVRPYMYSSGGFTYYQHYGNSTIDALIDSAINMPDGQTRNDTYQHLQWIYHMDSPGLPIAQALSRRWSRDWVGGWYLNQLYPGDFWYDLYKTTAPVTLIDLSVAMTNVTEYLNGLGYEDTVEIAYPYGTDQNPPIYISLSVTRHDTVPDPVPAVLSVMYIDSSGHQFVIGATSVSVPPKPSVVSDVFTLYDPSMKVGLYTVKGKASVFSSTYADSNLANNEIDGGGFNATWLYGDVNNDRIVDRLDSYKMHNAMDSYEGFPNYDVTCDIWGDAGAATSPTFAGDGLVEVMDDYGLATALGNHLPGCYLPYSAGATRYPWSTFHHDVARAGYTQSPASRTNATLWNYTTGDQIYSSPAVVGDKVYIGSLDNRIYCLDASAGIQLWNYTTGNSVKSSPAVADGKVFIGSKDDNIYCLNASTGEHIWNYATGGSVDSSPAVADGKVFVGSYDKNVYCLDASTGTKIWNYTTGNLVQSSPAVADDKVYVGSMDHGVYCLDAFNGTQMWTYQTGGSVYSSPAVADGMVFVGSWDHKLYAFGNVFKSENYASVQTAIDAAPAGAIVWVAAQIFNESLIINKTLTLIGKRGSDSTFVGGGYGIAIMIHSPAPGTIIAGFVITNYAQGIFFDGASNCKIYDNIMAQMSNSGIAEGTSTDNNAIYNNIFRENAVALNLTEHSTSNTIYNNTFILSNVGINVESSGNTIYWNIFVHNLNPVQTEPSLHNTWDNGYPDGGNYWSTHNNIDVYSGPGQNEVGGDGIADTAYNIVFAEADLYPLAKPFSEHDIGVMDVTPLKTIVGQGFTMHIVSGILNYGVHSEFFTAKVYANTIPAITQKILLEKRKTTLVMFVWDTTGFGRGNYTLKVCAEPVQGETDDTDNSFRSLNVTVVIPGDVNADGIVEMMDFLVACNAYNSQPGMPNWNPNADINDDSMVEMMDFFIMSQHYMEHEP
jgi:parallel beta-helix repeat protein